MRHYIRYEFLIIMGAILFICGLLNAIGIASIHSDYFWAIAGLGLIIEGLLEMRQNSRLKRFFKSRKKDTR